MCFSAKGSKSENWMQELLLSETNISFFAWVWSSGPVSNYAVAYKATFLYFFCLSVAILFYILSTRRQKRGLMSMFTKQLHTGRKIYGKVTTAIFLWIHHLWPTKHFPFSRVPGPSEIWPDVRIACRNHAMAQRWAMTLLNLRTCREEHVI